MKHSSYPPETQIDVYPVGVLADLRFAYRAIRSGHSGEGYRKLRWQARHITDSARVGDWRAVRNALNGYLAEPTPFPEGLKGCGHGWTKRRALRDLRRRYEREATWVEQAGRPLPDVHGKDGQA